MLPTERRRHSQVIQVPQKRQRSSNTRQWRRISDRLHGHGRTLEYVYPLDERLLYFCQRKRQEYAHLFIDFGVHDSSAINSALQRMNITDIDLVSDDMLQIYLDRRYGT